MQLHLVEIYIHEVARRLPKNMRDATELKLRSKIVNMLPNDHDENDVKEVLEQLGHPAKLANEYKGRASYLIGPRYYDAYVSLLKIILPIVVIIVALATMTKYLIELPTDTTLAATTIDILLATISNAFETGMQVFFGLTVAVALLERFDKRKGEEPLSSTFEAWTIDELKQIEPMLRKREISGKNVFWRLFWTAIWLTLFFYAHQLLGVYEGTTFITSALNEDVLRSFTALVVGVAAIDVLFTLYKWYVGYWTIKLAVINIVVELIILAAYLFIIVTPNLLNETFIHYVTAKLSLTNDSWDQSFIGVCIAIGILSTLVNIYEGFKKARATL